jgi:microcystin-dependent protein
VSNPYVGEIRMFGGNFAPVGWAFCNGQQMAISENDTLFTLIGTTYGGDGQETFNLPNLQGRLPVHTGTGSTGRSFTLGEAGGVESVTLTTSQTPSHGHTAFGSTDPAGSTQPQGNVPASVSAAGTVNAYGVLTPLTPLDPSTLGPVGGSQPHDNMHPFTCVNFIISLFGIFPSPT